MTTLNYGCLGNGVTAWRGDYRDVAHIDPCGAYKLYTRVSRKELASIEDMARMEGSDFTEYWNRLSPYRRANILAENVLTWQQLTE